MLVLVLLCLLFWVSLNAALMERPDIVFYEKKKRSSMTYPLEDYFKREGNPAPSEIRAAEACLRGHIATWEVVGDVLYLKNVKSPDGKKIVLRKIFPNNSEKNIKAFWFSDILFLLGPHVGDHYIFLDIKKGVVQKEYRLSGEEFFNIVDEISNNKELRNPRMSLLRNVLVRYQDRKKHRKSV